MTLIKEIAASFWLLARGQELGAASFPLINVISVISVISGKI